MGVLDELPGKGWGCSFQAHQGCIDAIRGCPGHETDYKHEKEPSFDDKKF
jgi:hypothetical protein